MTVARLAGMAGIGVDRIGAAADAAADPAVLRLENLDTDLRPPPAALAATHAAVDLDRANSYLPFLGADRLRAAAAALVGRASGIDYDWRRSAIVTAGGLSGILNVLLALLEPGDEVIMPSPIYIGLVNRVRLAGGVPVFVPMRVIDGAWRFDAGRLASAVTSRTRVFLWMSPAMPTGAVLGADDWRALADACIAADAWLLYDAAMARILATAAPRRPARHGGAYDHGRLGRQGATHDRLAHRLDRRAACDRGRSRAGLDFERRLPGRHRAGGGSLRARGGRRGRGPRDRRVAAPPRLRARRTA
jgi:aspartate/methionine/tyrosine aminotransferase